MEYMIGVDIGTTSTKAVLFTVQGEIKEMHHAEYPLYTPDSLTAEQKPDEIFTAVLSVIKQVVAKSQMDKSKLAFISFSSAMHSIIAVDEQGKPLTNCITWADKRAASFADELKENGKSEELYKRTGVPIHPMSPLVKIMWMKHEKKDIAGGTCKFVSIKEYIFYKFFGKFVVDYSIAAATGCLNITKLTWDEEALKAADISEKQLSKVVPTTHVLKGMKSDLAYALNINEDTPFVIGSSDGVLSNIGLGAIGKGEIAVTIGTSGAIRTITSEPLLDEQGRTFCYPLMKDRYVVGGSVNNGGVVLKWAKNELAKSETTVAERLEMNVYDLLTEMASKVNPGSDGLLFHPYLSGERAPLWNPYARGSFTGLSLHHKKEHIIRAVLEGVMYNLYTVLTPLQALIGEAVEIKASGGFARSEVWKQMMADIFDKKVTIPESLESSCLGAAVVGLYALELIDSIDAVKGMVGKVHTLTPIKENVEIYKEILPVYTDIMECMMPHYQKIAALQKESDEAEQK